MNLPRIGFVAIERISLASAIAGLGVWIYWYDGLPRGALDIGNALPAISALTSLCASLLGFMIAVIVFLLGLVEAEAFKIIRASTSYKDLWTIFKGAMISCSAASAIGLVAIIFIWFGTLPALLIWAFISSLAWLSLRIARIAWILNLIIDSEISRGKGMRKKIERG